MVVMTHVSHWMSPTTEPLHSKNAAEKPLFRELLIPALRKKYSETAESQSIMLEQKILDYVRDHQTQLKGDFIEKSLQQHLTDDQDSWPGYLRRFATQFWKDMLLMVHGVIGENFQHGSMRGYNCSKLDVSNVGPTWTMAHSVQQALRKDPEIAGCRILQSNESIDKLLSIIRPHVLAWASERLERALSQDELEQDEKDDINARLAKYKGPTIDCMPTDPSAMPRLTGPAQAELHDESRLLHVDCRPNPPSPEQDARQSGFQAALSAPTLPEHTSLTVAPRDNWEQAQQACVARSSAASAAPRRGNDDSGGEVVNVTLVRACPTTSQRSLPASRSVDMAEQILPGAAQMTQLRRGHMKANGSDPGQRQQCTPQRQTSTSSGAIGALGKAYDREPGTHGWQIKP